MNQDKEKNRIVKIVVLGDSCVGKTSIIHRFCTHSFDTSKYKATIGSDFMSSEVEVAENHRLTLQVWDTAGQERFRGVGSSYYRGANALTIVFDLTNAISFEHLNYWLEEFRSMNQGVTVPVLCLGNKTDAANEKRAVQHRAAKEWAEGEGFSYFECSAKTGQRVEEAFVHTAKEILTFESKHAGERTSLFSDTKDTVSMLRQSPGGLGDTKSLKPSKRKGGCC